MQDPLKQGLKHFVKSLQAMNFLTIRMQDPLKQGLKLFTDGYIPILVFDSNARSIKTRIETYYQVCR